MKLNRSMLRARFTQALYLSFILCILSGYLWLIYHNYQSHIPSDFQYLFYSAKCLVNFDNPYLTPILNLQNYQIEVRPSTNLAAPLLIYLIGTISKILTELQTMFVWTAASTLSLILGLFISQQQILKLSIKRDYLPHLFFLTLFTCTFYNFSYGQCGLIFFFGVSLFLVTYIKEHVLAATITLSIMTAFKLFFLFFIVLFVIKKQYRYLLLYLTLTTFFIVMPILHNIKPIFNAYLIATDHISWYLSNWNASFQGLLSRLLGSVQSKQNSLFYYPELAHILYLSLGAIYTFLTVLAYRHCSDKILNTGITLSTMLLICPLGWLYYFPIFYIPFLHAEKLIAHHHQKTVLTILLYTCLLLSSACFPFVAEDKLSQGFLVFRGNIPFLALFIFANIQLYLAFSSKTHTKAAPVLTQQSKQYIYTSLILINILCTSLTFLGFNVPHERKPPNYMRILNKDHFPTQHEINNERYRLDTLRS